MKKRVLLIMGLCLLLVSGGCSRNSAGDVKGSSSASPSVTSAAASTLATVTGIPEREEYKPDDYIKLGEYKGIEISVVKTTVTDAAVEKQIKTILESNKTYEKTDKTVVANGDIVNIDFKGTMNGKAFEGGSDTGFDLKIGSNTFIDGFEKGLIGKKVGDKVTLDLKFPTTYNSTDLAGKAVKFDVTINSIDKEVVPDLTDDYVKNNTKYETVADYKKAIRESMEVNKSDEYNTAYTAVVNAAKISSIPKSLTQYYTDVMNYQVYSMAKSKGITVEAYLKNNNMTVDSFNSYVASYVQNYATQDLVIDAIAKAENITVTDAEFNDEVQSYMKQYSISSEEELYKSMPKSEIKQSILSSKIMDFIVKNAKITYTAPTPTPAATATPAASK